MNGSSSGSGNVGRLFQDLRPRSTHSVSIAIQAAEHEGLTGTLIIQIFSGINKPTEVYFTNAELKLVPAIGIT